MTCRGCTHTHCACTVHAHAERMHGARTQSARTAHAGTTTGCATASPPPSGCAACRPSHGAGDRTRAPWRPCAARPSIGAAAPRPQRPAARQPDVPSPQPCAHTCTQVARPAASAAAGRLVDGAALLLARLAAGRQPARTARPLRLRDGREHRRQHPSRRVRKQVSQRAPAACTGKPAQASRGPRVPAWLGGGCEHATLLRKPALA